MFTITLLDFQDLHLRPERPKGLIIEGPSRTGKTAWARSHGLHNYFCEGVDFSDYNSDALYNVIDDIPFKFLPCKKPLLGAQKDFIVNEKYRKKTKLKGGIPCIVLCNPDMSYAKAISEDYKFSDWAEENLIFCNVTERLFEA